MLLLETLPKFKPGEFVSEALVFKGTSLITAVSFAVRFISRDIADTIVFFKRTRREMKGDDRHNDVV